MRIRQILNNNAVIACNQANQDFLLMGSGIGCMKKRGEEVEGGRVTQRFALDKALKQQIDSFIQSIPQKYYDLSLKALEEGKSEYYLDLRPSIYFTLADHLHFAHDRFKKGVELPNIYNIDIPLLYPKEWSLGKELYEYAVNRCRIGLSPMEPMFIAVHLIENQHHESNPGFLLSMEITEHVMGCVRESLNLELSRGTFAYFRFMNHVKAFVFKALERDGEDGEEKNPAVESLILQNGRIEDCIRRIQEDLRDLYDIQISRNEKAYLFIHLLNLLSDEPHKQGGKEKNQKGKKNTCEERGDLYER